MHNGRAEDDPLNPHANTHPERERERGTMRSSRTLARVPHRNALEKLAALFLMPRALLSSLALFLSHRARAMRYLFLFQRPRSASLGRRRRSLMNSYSRGFISRRIYTLGIRAASGTMTRFRGFCAAVAALT